MQSGMGRVLLRAVLPTCPGPQWLGLFPPTAATNKCLAQSNKSRTVRKATKKRTTTFNRQHRQEGQARALPMARMTEHDMIRWFNAAPMGSRQQRMLWAAHKIARLTGATEGGIYQMLERSLERAGPPPSGSSVQRQRWLALAEAMGRAQDDASGRQT